MARFAPAPSAPTRSAPFSIGAPMAPAPTFNGGDGFAPTDPHAELFNATLAGMLADGFYESGDDRVARVADLVRQCDPAWLAGFTYWLRSTAGLRSAPIVVAAEYAAADFRGARQVVESVLRRPDEPGELLAYWHSRHGRNIPPKVKRGVADALPRLYNERTMLKWDGNGKTWRFADVIQLVHPKPHTAEQSALYKYALDRRRGVAPPNSLPLLARTAELDAINPDERHQHITAAVGAGWSWERLAGWLPSGMTAEAWQAIVPRLGYLALIRNLNNFDRLGVDAVSRDVVAVRLTDPQAVKSSGVLPHQILSAYAALEADTYRLPLGTAADLALDNLPHLPGRTLIMVDCSGSMSSPAGSGRSRSPLSLSRVAGLMAEAVARRCDDAVIACYDSVITNSFHPARHVGVLRAASEPVYAPRGSTNTWRCAVDAFRQFQPSRVIILTDEQANDSDDGSIGVPVITWNLAGYQAHHARHGTGRRYFVSGYNDFAMQVLPFLAGGTGRWPWE